MIICPECATERKDDAPCACGWTPSSHDGLPEYFTRRDRESQFNAAYFENYENLARINLEKSNIDRTFLRNQAKNIVKYVRPVDGLHACDIGIGQGFLCDELLAAGVDRVTAVDVAPSFLARFGTHERVKPYLANAEHLPFRNEFDLIVSTDVMEHVINVGSFLYCVNRALRMDGRAAIRVPYREGLLNYSPHMKYGHAFGHMRSFNKDILRIYMRQAGFEVVGLHLDGFSLGTPQPHLYSTPRRKHWYHKFYNFWNARLAHPADATLWPSMLARLAMRPAEIVVVGRKVADISSAVT
jgi:SAM-dependent methyltransferase